MKLTRCNKLAPSAIARLWAADNGLDGGVANIRRTLPDPRHQLIAIETIIFRAVFVPFRSVFADQSATIPNIVCPIHAYEG